jgi:hypothetical protein
MDITILIYAIFIMAVVGLFFWPHKRTNKAPNDIADVLLQESINNPEQRKECSKSKKSGMSAPLLNI